MRIAYVCLDPGVPVFGRKGSSVHCQEVIRALRQRGFNVELFATRLGDDVPRDLASVPRHALRCRFGKESRERERALIDLNPQIYDLLESAGPFDMVYERYSLWSHAAMQFADEQGIPGVLEVNSPLVDEQKTYRTLHDETAAKNIRGQCFRHAASLIAVSEQVAEKARRNYFAKSKTTVVPNGVNCQTFNRPVNGRTNCADKTVVGFVGTLKPWHGVSNLLEAFARVHSANPNLVLRIVGDGPQRERLEHQLSGLSNETQTAVEWMGAIPCSEVPKVLSTFDIAVAPYPELQDFYFSPLKIMEYMAAGLPVIGSRIGQIPSLIEHGVTGLLVEPGCPNELTHSINLLADDHEIRGQLGRAARRYVELNHTWDSVVERILATLPQSTLPSPSEVR